MSDVFVRIFRFYRDGFRSMTIGRTLWIVIAVKLAIMFLILKIFFFPNKLKSEYSTDEERSEAVRTTLINRK